MAFDFLSYIVDQIQHNSQLFVEKPKELRKYIISHITSFQLMHLLQLKQDESYQIIQQEHTQLNTQNLSSLPPQLLEKHLRDDIQHIEKSYQQITTILLDELKQLDFNENLGASGIKELLDGQLPWIQNTVDDWFWEAIQATEYKITKTHKNNEPNFNQIMKDFNQIILQKEQIIEHSADLGAPSLTSDLVQTPRIFIILQPIIALLILCFLQNLIL